MRRSSLPVLGICLLLAACDAAPADSPARAGAGPPSAEAIEAEPAAASPGATAPGLSARPEATSLSGAPLYPRAPDSTAEARLQAQLDSAEQEFEARPGNAEAILWLGRRQAYLGHYREAIRTFTDGIDLHKDDARFYRHRGHRYITVRELDRAVEDLEHAARLVSGKKDIPEPDGQPNAAGVPRSTLHTNIWYHLGLARYVQRDFEGAAHAFRWGLEIAPNDDMRVAMSDWLWLSLKRLERDEEARELLASIRPGMNVLENQAYHRLLMLYKGELDRDTLIPAPADPEAAPDPVLLATYHYGLAAWHLARRDRIRARTELERVLATGAWPAFGYLAAEADLLELGDAPPRPDTLGSSRRFSPAGGAGGG